jgi:hypothetical protein
LRTSVMFKRMAKLHRCSGVIGPPWDVSRGSSPL